MVDNCVSMAAPPSGKGSSSRPPAAPQVVTADASVGAANTGAEVSLNKSTTDGSDEYLGKTFGKYRVTKRLGNGGMAVVYQAEDLLMKRQVAMKFLSGAFLHKPAAIERFMREAQVAGRLSHPNIIAIHDVSKEARACFIVMELLSPGSAGQHLKQKGPYYWVVATRIITDCCAALKVAHDAGVIHRDIKPDPASPSAVGAVIASYRRCLVGNPRARFFDLPLAESPLSSLALCSKLESSAYRM